MVGSIPAWRIMKKYKVSEIYTETYKRVYTCYSSDEYGVYDGYGKHEKTLFIDLEDVTDPVIKEITEIQDEAIYDGYSRDFD